MKKVLVTGAGGFIGHHLVKFLKARGDRVRGVDVKAPEFEESPADEFSTVDLRQADACVAAVEGVEEVYHLAADMGGIGYITADHAGVARNSTMIDLQMLEAAREAGVGRFFFSSTACVYPQHLQESADVAPLTEDTAFPADPEEGYGWSKIYTEKLCQYYREDFGLETRIARFHNVYGPLGTYDGGKEKAPAAICRKIALAEDGGEIPVWGDGMQTRSFMYIDDCLEGIDRIMRSDHTGALNLGRDDLVTIRDLVGIVAEISGKKITPRYDPGQPQGVRGRNSENTKIREVLGWAPSISLQDGLAKTYRWIEEQLRAAGRLPSGAGAPGGAR